MRFRDGTPPNFQADSQPEGRYLKARQEWDDRIGSARVQAANWRRAFFAMTLLTVILAGGLVALSLRPQVTPYIVEVGANGRVMNVAALPQQISPTDAQIALTLHQFVQRIRSVPMDTVLLRRNWLEAYAFLSESGSTTLTQLAEKEQTFSRAGRDRVEVIIQDTLKQTHQTFQVAWRETLYGLGGDKGKSREMVGTFQISPGDTQDPEKLKLNPFGVSITAFTITESKPLQ
ncbi:conjugal transfer protein TrbF [Lacibacterium aquatile]|uniref:Conjugal transfer protein TrbF n=1 Tax=Lacibacterium aquatile TaxID=1168082 RepID=A0ABW5DQV9_9PROT